MSSLKALSMTDIRAQLRTAREGNHLYNQSFWKHNNFEQVVQVTTVSYDGDINEVVVQFRYQDHKLENLSFSQRQSAFLRCYHQVERVQRWEKVVDRPDR